MQSHFKVPHITDRRVNRKASVKLVRSSAASTATNQSQPATVTAPVTDTPQVRAVIYPQLLPSRVSFQLLSSFYRFNFFFPINMYLLLSISMLFLRTIK